MAKVPTLIVLLPQLLCMLLEVSGQQSPCSEYFTYILDSSNQTIGQIQIPSPPKNIELHLKVTLSIDVALPTKYVGQLKLAQSKKESVQIQKEPLLYHIHFPLLQPLPSLTGIWFNRQQYCSGPQAIGQVVTSIMLVHTLYRPPTLPYLQSSSDFAQQNPDKNFQLNISLPTPKPTIPIDTSTLHTPVTLTDHLTTQHSITSSVEIDNNPFLKPPVQKNDTNKCGISNRPLFTNTTSLMSEINISSGQWPWNVAIFYEMTLILRCVGSILTNKHVITAAHCLKLDPQTILNEMSVLLGLYQLYDWDAALKRNIASYTLHPDYKNQINADSDLAILTLNTPVEFSSTIKPICMWYSSLDLESVVNKTGYIGWWGFAPFLPDPRITKAPIVSQESCLKSDSRFSRFISNRTLCAGMKDGSGPCRGAGGIGLMLYDPVTERYHLRGILSRVLYALNKEKNTQICDATQYNIYVDVTKYLSWIHQQIST